MCSLSIRFNKTPRPKNAFQSCFRQNLHEAFKYLRLVAYLYFITYILQLEEPPDLTLLRKRIERFLRHPHLGQYQTSAEFLSYCSYHRPQSLYIINVNKKLEVYVSKDH